LNEEMYVTYKYARRQYLAESLGDKRWVYAI
jgi:hypothetical protein